VVDSNSLPVRLALSPGEAHDVRLAGKLLSRLESGSTLLADRGYDADWIRELAMKKGAWANIPPKSNRSDPICFSPYLYRARNRVERFFNRIKHVVGWRRAMTGLLPTTLPSFNSRQSGYGCALMSPHPNLIEWYWNQIHMYTFEHFLGTNAHLLLDSSRIDSCAEERGVR
jgi:transposase